VPELHEGMTGKAGADSIRTGLLGREILASRSPWIHEQEAQAQGVALSYTLFDFTARGWADGDLAQQLDALQHQGFAGLNVTHPFKQMIIPHLDSLAESAASVGAVNTVRFAGGQRIGHNTDVTGFAASVRSGLAGAQMDHVVQFGAGGAGSATATALLSLGVPHLTLVESHEERRAVLADRLAKAFPAASITTCAPGEASLRDADGVVNATPVGMAAHPGTPFDPDWLHDGLWVADIVYFPLETALLKEARARGLRVLDGKGMAVFQAADAFDIFTGLNADRARMLASFDAFGVARAA
jgi:shikimate dehydrogenase